MKSGSNLILIDGPNIWASCRILQLQFNYIKLLEWLTTLHGHHDVRFYTSYHKDDNGFIGNKRLTDFLEYHGITVIQREAKIISRGDEEALVKGNLDVEIAVDIVTIGCRYDNIMLFSGDGDFVYPLRYIRDMGKRVVVFSSIGQDNSNKNVASDNIRRVANQFIDLAKEQSFPWLEPVKSENKN